MKILFNSYITETHRTIFLPSAVAFFSFPFCPISHLCCRVIFSALGRGAKDAQIQKALIVPIASDANEGH